MKTVSNKDPILCKSIQSCWQLDKGNHIVHYTHLLTLHNALNRDLAGASRMVTNDYQIIYRSFREIIVTVLAYLSNDLGGNDCP